MVKITKRVWQYLWRYQPPPKVNGGSIHRHPLMFNPPPNAVGKSTCDDSPHRKSKSGRTNDLLVVIQINKIKFDGFNCNIRQKAWTHYHPPPT